MNAPDVPIHVFCSFAPEDADLCSQLHNHLRPLERAGVLTLWHQRLITAGTDWTKAIDEHLASASIILLLISPAFFASDYCYGVEMQQAMQQHKKGDARVIPVLFRSVSWQEAPFSHLSVLPGNKKPVTLWSNRDAAFTEIVASIRQVVEELMPSSSKPLFSRETAVWTVPFQRHPFFTGQQEVLKKLAETLRTDQSAALTQPQAITGLGGIGKTLIAVEYAWQHRGDYMYVLWSRADSHEALVSGYVALAGHLNLLDKEEKDQTVIVQAVLRWLSTHAGWLLILDNIEDLAVLKDFLLPDRRGHLLLTTRAQATGTLAHPIEVEIMPPEVGATLLLRRAKMIAPDASLDVAPPAEVGIARTISEELGGLPLALDQAGAFIEETQCSLAHYQELFRSQSTRLLQLRGSSTTDYPASVATTWGLSFERVTQQNPAAAALLTCCAFLHPDATPEELFAEGAAYLGPALQQVGHDPLPFDEAVRVLRSYSLIHRDPSTTTLSVHRLVQAVLVSALSTEEREQWQVRVVEAINAVFPEKVRFELAKCERLLQHVLVCVTWIESRQKPIRADAGILDRAGTYLRERGQYAEAESLLLHALAIREQHFGSDQPDIATSLNNLASLYWLQGRDEQAEPLYQRALSIREHHLGPDHPDTAASLNNLANLYWKQSKYEQAESFYQRALSIYEQRLGPDHPDSAMSLGNLANLYVNQSKYEQAEPLYQRSLAIRTRQLGPDHPDVAQSLNNLAGLYQIQGKYEQAEPLHQRACFIWEQCFGPDHPDVAMSLDNLAELYYDQGKYKQAETLFVRAIAIREHALDPNHPDLAETLHKFAVLQQSQGHHDTARFLYERTLAARTKTLGSAHPDTIDTRERLHAVLTVLSKIGEAGSLGMAQLEPTETKDGGATNQEESQCRQKSQSSADENQK